MTKSKVDLPPRYLRRGRPRLRSQPEGKVGEVDILEAAIGIEPMNKGFADPSSNMLPSDTTQYYRAFREAHSPGVTQYHVVSGTKSGTPKKKGAFIRSPKVITKMVK